MTYHKFLEAYGEWFTINWKTWKVANHKWKFKSVCRSRDIVWKTSNNIVQIAEVVETVQKRVKTETKYKHQRKSWNCSEK